MVLREPFGTKEIFWYKENLLVQKESFGTKGTFLYEGNLLVLYKGNLRFKGNLLVQNWYHYMVQSVKIEKVKRSSFENKRCASNKFAKWGVELGDLYH